MNGTAHIAYETDDNHIHEMAVGQKGTWRDNDIMRATGSPALESAILTGFPWPAGNTQQIAYTSPWTFTDLTALTGAPLAAGSALAASAWETGRTKYVAYVGSNNHIYELQMPLQGSWEHTDLTQLLGLPEASEDVLATHEWLPEFAKHIVYLDTAENPHIHSLMLKHGSQWQHTDVTRLTGSQSIV